MPVFVTGHPQGPDALVAHTYVEDHATGLCRDCGHERTWKAIHVGDNGAPISYRTVRLSAIDPMPVRWLWQGRIPLGKITVLDGDPNVGKSTLATTFAAHVTQGRQWPDGGFCPFGDVLMLSAEDGDADTVRPRFDAAGGDPDRFHILKGVIAYDKEGDSIEVEPHLANTSQIEAAISDNLVKLVIVDVLMAFLPHGTDSHRDQDVRGILRPLKGVAERTGCAVLLLRHLNKGSGNPLYRGGGSIGIVGAARSGLLAARDTDDPGLMVLASTKSNLAAAPPSLSYRMVDHEGVGKIEWGSEVARTADDLLGDATADREEQDALAQWLADYVSSQGGQVAASDAMKAAFAIFGPLNKMAFKRARKRAGVTTRKIDVKAGWVWEL